MLMRHCISFFYNSVFLYCLGDMPVYLLKYFPKKEMSGKFSE